jgi:PKD repeat protein
LSEYKINWDLDADGKVDQADQVRFSHTYVDPKLHKITFNLPIQ